MNAIIVQSGEPVTLIGGAPVDPLTLAECLRIAPQVVAADGAASTALVHGIMPRAVIGDMDSLPAADRARIGEDRIHRIADQETTDFDKALRSIAAPLVLAVGFTGARLDHELAAYTVLVSVAGPPCIVVGHEDICFHAPQRLTLELESGTRVSLFPMRPVTGTSTGLEWPIDGLDLAPWARVGTSNLATRAQVTVDPHGPGLLVILPRSCLSAAVRALGVSAPG
ncbi:thiamine diphosphokinase [Anianabacter salinae]|uniref:thiamine diphosphokinase n=1 Tax=Anianabacter salinae TaxID=2851023 RepID=UPI00225DFBFC|nr:thiamine diphosphokinase [Anianabacter salinae]MBV0911259.1 thiamine diphosphokinase [Anianabacter salinae]